MIIDNLNKLIKFHHRFLSSTDSRCIPDNIYKLQTGIIKAGISITCRWFSNVRMNRG